MNLADFLAVYDQRLTYQYSAHSERALYLLLKLNEDKLPPLDKDFHKTFRQTDVTGESQMDMAIWNLLQGASIFWQLFKKHFGELP